MMPQTSGTTRISMITADLPSHVFVTKSPRQSMEHAFRSAAKDVFKENCALKQTPAKTKRLCLDLSRPGNCAYSQGED
jgi:hypothetical protein